MRGLDISCDTEDGERLCTPSQGGAAGLGGLLAASPHPNSAWRRCLFLLPRLRALRGGRGRRQLEAGAWPGAAGRGLLGRLLATGRGIAGRSRPRRPGGLGAEGSRRSSPAEPRDPALLCERQRPSSGGEGAAGPGGTSGIAPPRAGPGRRAQCPLQAAVGGRCVPAAPRPRSVAPPQLGLPTGPSQGAGQQRERPVLHRVGQLPSRGPQRSLAALWRVFSACQRVADLVINRGPRFCLSTF